MLHLISIGLFNENDMSINAVETAMHCDELYCEFYTSQLDTTAEKLGKFIGKPVSELRREDLENNMGKILADARDKDIGILVGGDCLTATTHIALLVEAKKLGIGANIVHGSSIYTAVAKTGLQIYKFGRVTTLPSFKARSCYDVIEQNLKSGLHTLVLLDIGMPVKKAVESLLELENNANEKIISGRKIVACCQLGGKEEKIKYGFAKDLKESKELDKIQACLLIPGDLHFMEEEALAMYS